MYWVSATSFVLLVLIKQCNNIHQYFIKYKGGFNMFYCQMAQITWTQSHKNNKRDFCLRKNLPSNVQTFCQKNAYSYILYCAICIFWQNVGTPVFCWWSSLRRHAIDELTEMLHYLCTQYCLKNLPKIVLSL
jgi:hypothetical protein